MSDKRYVCEVYCPDCTGKDEQGCFEGGAVIKTFSSARTADDYGVLMTFDSVWEYKVYEEKERGDG